jgi:hypothetical protein
MIHLQKPLMDKWVSSTLFGPTNLYGVTQKGHCNPQSDNKEVLEDVKSTIMINWFCFVLQPLMNH